MIAFFYEGHTNPNGAASFAEHLAQMLRMEGYDVKFFNVRKVHSIKPRKLTWNSDVGIYRVTLDEAEEIVKNNPSFVTQLPMGDAKEIAYYERLFEYGIPMAVHPGPGKLDANMYLWAADVAKSCGNVVVAFCEASADMLRSKGYDNVVRSGYPYVRRYHDYEVVDVDYHAVAISRVASEKRTDIVCAANLALPDEYKVKIFGTISGRIYEYRYLQKHFPNWKDDWMDSPHTHGIETHQLCRNTIHGIDLAEYAWNGGRAHYTFLEMMDAGCNLILNKRWLDFPGEMQEGYNCVAVESAEELVEELLQDPDPNYDGYVETLASLSAPVVLPPLLDVILDY